MRLALVAVASVFLLGACGDSGAHNDAAVLVAPPRPAELELVLDSLVPTIRGLGEESLGITATMRLQPRIDTVTAATSEHDVVLESALTARWLATGAIQSVCEVPKPDHCTQGPETFVAEIATLRWEGPDQVVAEVGIRQDPGFLAVWNVVLNRRGEVWQVSTKTLRLIT